MFGLLSLTRASSTEGEIFAKLLKPKGSFFFFHFLNNVYEDVLSDTDEGLPWKLDFRAWVIVDSNGDFSDSPDFSFMKHENSMFYAINTYSDYYVDYEFPKKILSQFDRQVVEEVSEYLLSEQGEIANRIFFIKEVWY